MRNERYWVGDVSNQWDDHANWRDGLLPGDGDIVVDTTGNEMDLRLNTGAPHFHRMEFMAGKMNILTDVPVADEFHMGSRVTNAT